MYIIVCNLLEVSFAAPNFYLYCFCNKGIRNKVGPSKTNLKGQCHEKSILYEVLL